MPDLDFIAVGAEAVTFAVSPLLNIKIRIINADPDEEIQNVLLRCQIQIETVRRKYADTEKEKLFELYGEPDRWGQTLKTLHWTHANVTVPPFSGSTEIDLPVPCTFDFNVAATKYFDGLDDGEIPLCLLFSGTVFYSDDAGVLQIGQISWERETSYGLPLSVWKNMIAHYYPNSAWLSIRKDVFDKLNEYRMRQSIPSWEHAFECLLRTEKEGVPTNGNGSRVGVKN